MKLPKPMRLDIGVVLRSAVEVEVEASTTRGGLVESSVMTETALFPYPCQISFFRL